MILGLRYRPRDQEARDRQFSQATVGYPWLRNPYHSMLQSLAFGESNRFATDWSCSPTFGRAEFVYANGGSATVILFI